MTSETTRSPLTAAKGATLNLRITMGVMSAPPPMRYPYGEADQEPGEDGWTEIHGQVLSLVTARTASAKSGRQINRSGSHGFGWL